MSYYAIHTLLDTHLQTVATLPLLQTENTLIRPSNAAAWCRSTLLPAATTTESIGVDGRQRKSGLFQVDLFYINNGGYKDASQMADLVVAAFSKGLYLDDGTYKVMILRSYVDAAKPFPNYYQLPVVVEWDCFV